MDQDKPRRVVAVTDEEGGKWHKPIPGQKIYAILFSDGNVWDSWGWRTYTLADTKHVEELINV